MRAVAAMLIPILASAVACRDEPPAWLTQMQARIAAEPVTNPPSQLLRFDYHGQTVVYRPPYCCDIQGELYASDGTLLCHPDGGITGSGDGRCTDFFSARRDCAVLWSDPRAKRAPSGCAAPAAAPVR